MAISASEKIFVDPNEEIVTVIERLLNSDKERIILVIPQNSILLSSYISINILFREIAKSKKIAVLVTEDAYGKHIAEKAGFLVAAKVSSITNEMWEESATSKVDVLSKFQNRKIENLQNINEDPSTIQVDIPESQQFPTELSNSEIVQESNDQLETIENENSELLETSMVDESLDQNPEQDMQDLNSAEVENHIEAQTDPSTESLLKRYQKPRREPKMVNIDGIEILSGGDLKKFDKESARAKILGENNMSNDEIDNTTSLDASEAIQEDLIRRPIKSFSNKSSFTGMDFKRSSGSTGFLAGLFNRSSKRQSVNRFSNPQDRNKKIAIISFLVLIFALVGIWFVSFQLSSVDITLTLKKEDVSTEGTITIDPTLSTVDTAQFKIPGQLLQINEVSLSRTGEANGQGVRGNKSKGVIDILNTLDKDVTLPVGTKITSNETSLVYLLTKEVTIKKATAAAEGSTVSGATRLEDVQIEAEKPGANYNIVDSDTNKDFKIEGYTLSQVKGSRYANITGGTSEAFTSVSADNIKTVKDVILPDLQKEAESKLTALVPSGYTLLKETIKFEETESKAAPAEGEESLDKTFSLTVKGKVSGMAIKQADLETVAKEILKNDQNGDTEIKNVADLQIDKVEEVESSYVLSISSKGSITKSLDEVEIKEAVAGLSMQEVRDYFSLFDEIEKYRVVFAPQIVPSFLQKVPTDFDRINLKIQ